MQKEKDTISSQFQFALSPPEKNQAALLAAIEQFGLENALPEACRYRLGLIVDELVTNILVHGTIKGPDLTINVHIFNHENELVIEIIDTGRPFDPTGHPLSYPCPESASLVIGGRGLCLVRRLADRIHYTRSKDHNHLLISLNKAKQENTCNLEK